MFESNISLVVDILLQSMDRFDHYFIFQRRILSLLGLWNTQPYRERLLRFCVAGFMSLYCVLAELCQLFTMNIEWHSIVRTLQMFLPTASYTLLYYNVVLNFVNVKKIFNYIEHDWQRLNDNTELKIMLKHVYMNKIFAFFCIVSVCGYVAFSTLPSLLRIILSRNEVRSDLDLYPIISCFDYFSNRGTYYYPVVMYQIMTVLVIAITAIACFPAYFSFIQHALAQLSIIKYKLYSPFIRNNNKDNFPVTPIDCSPWITDIIRHLARTSEFVTLINSTFETSYFTQMSVAFIMLIMDIVCILFSLKYKLMMYDVLMFVIYICGTLFAIYLNCYLGQRLIDHSVDVYKEACMIPYHEMSLKTQKLFLTMLLVNAKPNAISFGKIFISSHEFFSNLLGTSLSFAMVLRSVQNI